MTPTNEALLAKTAGGHLSHEEVATKVRMLMRMDLDHEAVCTMARDRIVWLANRVAELETALSRPQDGASLEALIVAMAENYEMYAEEGHYIPSERERMLLLDFAHEVAEALSTRAGEAEYNVACDVLGRLVGGLRQQFPDFPDCDSDDAEADVLRGISGYIENLLATAQPAQQPKEESRAITALKVTLFGVECYLPSSIAKSVQASCDGAAQVGEAAVPAPAAGDAVMPTGDKFTVERHGDGWAIYKGRDRQHHGLNLGHLTECSAELAADIADGLNLLGHEPAQATPPESSDQDGRGEDFGVALKPSTVLDALRPTWKRWGYTEDEMKCRAVDSSTDISLLWDAGKLTLPATRAAAEDGEAERGQFYVCPLCHGPGTVTQETHDLYATPSEPTAPENLGEFVIALLIAGGYVTEAKVTEARKIALSHGPYELPTSEPTASGAVVASAENTAKAECWVASKDYMLGWNDCRDRFLATAVAAGAGEKG